ncbi:MAG: zf-HC2 domain-containing protein, partial [Planctomycetes bacterium]|nr:zf-HC2 domain-containing protein [Planctomycetota bacterium]
MNCIEAKEQIEFYVLGELSESQGRRLGSHLAECSDCRKAEAEYRLIIGEIRQSAQANLRPTGLERDILASVEREVGTIGRRSIADPMKAIAASIAACLLIGLAAWQIW